jgi:multidrug efflux pump
VRLPTGFLPNEDQGGVFLQYQLPPGATIARSQQVADAVEKYLLEKEGRNISVLFVLAGGGRGAGGQNQGLAFMKLVPWDERPGKENTAQAIADRATGAFRGLRDARVFVTVPGAVRGLSSSNGFSMEFRNVGSLPADTFEKYRDELLDAATDDPKLSGVRLSDLPDLATLLAVFYIPLFFVIVRRGVRDGIAAVKERLHHDDPPAGEEAPA